MLKLIGQKFTKEETSWILYDWANSAYSLVIVTALLPIYFKSVATGSGISESASTAYWGYASSFGTLLVSISAPLLGTIADYKGFKKKFFTFFALTGMIMTLMLALVPNHSWIGLLAIYIISHVGFSGANIFYDGFLVDVTTDERSDLISSYGYGLGYIGSALLFIIVVLLQLFGGKFFDVALLTKISFVLTAVWWFVFSLSFLKNVHQRYGVAHDPKPVRASVKRLAETLRHIRQYKVVMFFLIAYFFYIDGVDTIFTMATSFGIDMGISSSTLLVILLMVNIVAFPFTILYGNLAKRFGTKPMILTAIGVYILICCLAMIMSKPLHFWILGFLVATSQGGIQALSRSYFSRIIPKERSNEFFGFYNIFGKFSAVMGPLLFGVVTQLTGRSQLGIASLIVLFIVGGLMFIKVPDVEKNNGAIE
ncbi:MFS transporter [Vagococcus elongatus]|uniref:MFS transporter n=1 Tax=Vagococcus elongatus TaxID=180344 RepID=A0A430AHN5_9ENTE|nr:MFS transporter [Vagococcus elongatus]RSU07609.1 MFS transporter [Vagococcus elongatus]